VRDYRRLDISKYANTGARILGKGMLIPGGKIKWHGLPFQLPGKKGAGRVLAFGKGVRKDAQRIAIGLNVRHLIFAHRLLDSKIREGDPIGRPCAEYVFHFAGGERLSVPIRERLEIGVAPADWGQLAMLAYPDQANHLLARNEGQWGELGFRQCETFEGRPQEFYLWPWTNPHPERVLDAVEVKPLGPRFYIGAVTLSFLEEPPFNRSAKKPVKITLTDKKDAQKPFKLEVEVDRGVATYPYALPLKNAEQFLKDPFKGWGETQNESASPAYVEIAASKSATVTVKQDGKKIGSANWGELTNKKKHKSKRLELSIVEDGRNWVRTTVLDDESGKPVPCRVHFRSMEGVPYQPHGHHTHVNGNLGTWHIDIGGDLRLGQITYAYIDGKCEGWLPRGELVVDIARGFEYQPIRQKVEIKPGQQELTFRLKRFGNPNKERYFSGDTHVHFLSTQGSHLEAAGEGLNVVNLLLSQWGHLFTNTEEFTGKPSVSPNGETIVYATQENRQHMLGHLTLLGLKEMINPWCSDGPSEAEIGGNLETTLSDWADRCHEQGGTVVIPHLPTPNCEPAALIATGRADAVEMITSNLFQHLEYYRYLNCGYKLPLVGGTDKMSSDVPVGMYRTYVHIPDNEPFNYDTWCKYMRAGNTYHSGGPLMQFKVEGKPIGSTIDLPGNGGEIEAHAIAESTLPIHSLEFVVNGQVAARTEVAKGTQHLELREKLRIEKHSWICARCSGPQYFKHVPHHDCWKRGIMAHTSPVYLAVGEPWWMFDMDAANYMLTLLHGGLSYLHQRPLQWEKGTVTHHHGKEEHLQFLEEPFRQAIAAIHKRMHALGIPH